MSPPQGRRSLVHDVLTRHGRSRPNAEYHPSYPVHLAIDPGVHTGAVWFQVRPRLDGQGHKVNVFADYFAEGLSAETNAREISEKTRTLCGVGDRTECAVTMDPTGNARTAVGPTVRGEYERAGVLGRNGLEIVAGAARSLTGCNSSRLFCYRPMAASI